MTASTTLLAAGLCSFVLFFSLALVVSRWRELPAIDRRAARLGGKGTRLAALFTLSGRSLPLSTIALVAVVATVVLRGSVIAAVAICVTQMLSQLVNEAVKNLVRRARPDEWFVHEELGFSFPSGHATTATLFFGSWFVYVALSPMPAGMKTIALAVIAVWIAGIDWSRVALAAHYPTDVLGGTLFGLGWLCVLWATLLHFGVRV